MPWSVTNQFMVDAQNTTFHHTEI